MAWKNNRVLKNLFMVCKCYLHKRGTSELYSENEVPEKSVFSGNVCYLIHGMGSLFVISSMRWVHSGKREI